MGKKILCLLSFLALLSTVPGHVTSIPECTAQAWARAPDLIPNTIVQGDARVKISGDCPSVDTVALGLRFKERSFVKALRTREDAKLLTPIPLDFSIGYASHWPPDEPSRKAREELITNKDRWVVREEERLVFETTQPFDMGKVCHGGTRDAVHDFAILVPATNFPPGLQRQMSAGVFGEEEILKVQWIYEYFAEVSFSNGTRKDVSAGFTSFHPVYDPDNTMQGKDSETVVDLEAFHNVDRLIANYSIEISAESGLTFFTGAKQNALHAVISRTGLARTFSAPLDVHITVGPGFFPKWAVKYDIGILDHIYQWEHRSTHVLHTMQEVTSGERAKNLPFFPGVRHYVVTVTMPDSSLEEIHADKIVTTTSATFTIPIELDEMHTIANFETYYETLINTLSIGLNTPIVEGADPDDPLGGSEVQGRRFEDDEEAWVPWEKTLSRTWMPYWGSIPIVIYPASEAVAQQRCLLPSTDQTILSHDSTCEQVATVSHYLEQGARGPIFVDRGEPPPLLVEDPAKRALRAPILEPVVSSPPEGEELMYRYYDWQQIYVGETWSKKVANRKH